MIVSYCSARSSRRPPTYLLVISASITKIALVSVRIDRERNESPRILPPIRLMTNFIADPPTAAAGPGPNYFESR